MFELRKLFYFLNHNSHYLNSTLKVKAAVWHLAEKEDLLTTRQLYETQ